MMLDGKTAVVYGAGSIGGAVARAFAREGAHVHLAGRSPDALERVAEDIRTDGGVVQPAQVDALDERAVDEHTDKVAAESGGIDVLLNVISHHSVHGTPMTEMSVDDFCGEVGTMVRTTFLTWRAAARHMIPRGSGVILAFGGAGDPMRDYYLGGTQVAFDTVETMRQQLSMEVGRHGIRIVTLRTGGVPESLPDDFEGRDAIVDTIVEPTMLGRAATLEDVGQVAAFVASDRARTMTAATVNISCGALID